MNDFIPFDDFDNDADNDAVAKNDTKNQEQDFIAFDDFEQKKANEEEEEKKKRREAGDYSDMVTELPKEDWVAFNKWASTLPKNLQTDKDYDLEGYWLGKGKPKVSDGEKEQLIERYKLPNNPTFSIGSKFSTADRKGGHWVTDEDGKRHFYPSQSNYKHYGKDKLEEHFKENHPDAVLHKPGEVDEGYEYGVLEAQQDQAEMYTGKKESAGENIAMGITPAARKIRNVKIDNEERALDYLAMKGQTESDATSNALPGILNPHAYSFEENAKHAGLNPTKVEKLKAETEGDEDAFIEGLSQLATEEITNRTRVKRDARERYLANKDKLNIAQKAIDGGINNTGYTLEFVGAAAVPGAGTVAQIAFNTAVGYSERNKNDFEVSEDGELVRHETAESGWGALGKSALQAGTEVAVERALGAFLGKGLKVLDKGAGKLLGKGKEGLVVPSAKKVLKDGFGKSQILKNQMNGLAEYGGKFAEFAKKTGIHNPVSEDFEEVGNAFFDNALGLGKKYSEYGEGEGTYWERFKKEAAQWAKDTADPKWHYETMVGMALTMGAQSSFATAIKEYDYHKAKSNVRADILDVLQPLTDNLDDEHKNAFSKLSTDQLIVMVDMLKNVNLSPEFIDKFKDDQNFHAALATFADVNRPFFETMDVTGRYDNDAERFGGDVVGNAIKQGVKSKFKIAKGKDGKPMFARAMNAKTGEAESVMYDGASGITLTDNGVASGTVEREFEDGSKADVLVFKHSITVTDRDGRPVEIRGEGNNETEARDDALNKAQMIGDRMSIRNQLLDVQRSQKIDFIKDRIDRFGTGVAFELHNTMRECVNSGIVNPGQSDFNWRNGYFTDNNGTVHFIIDNIQSAFDFEVNLFHEAGIHAGLHKLLDPKAKHEFLMAMSGDKKMQAWMEIINNSRAKKKLAPINFEKPQNENDWHWVEEAFAYAFQSRHRSPSAMTRVAHAMNNLSRKYGLKDGYSDADRCVMVDALISKARQGDVLSEVDGKTFEDEDAPDSILARNLVYQNGISNEGTMEHSEMMRSFYPAVYKLALIKAEGDHELATAYCDQIVNSLNRNGVPLADINGLADDFIVKNNGEEMSRNALDEAFKDKGIEFNDQAEEVEPTPTPEPTPDPTTDPTPTAEPAPTPTEGNNELAIFDKDGNEIKAKMTPVKDIELSDDIPNFKRDADIKTGVVKQLEGKFDQKLAGPIVLLRRKDGKLNIVTGRHRLDLAKRSGTDKILSIVVDEADSGIGSLKWANWFDAYSNINNGDGTLQDYISFFNENDQINSYDDAKQFGYIPRVGSKGDLAARLVFHASPDVRASLSDGSITEKQASILATVGEGNHDLQRIGLKLIAKSHPNDQVLELSLKGIKHELEKTKTSQGTQDDLFGSTSVEDGPFKGMNLMDYYELKAKTAAKCIKELEDERAALNGLFGTSKNEAREKTAAKYGFKKGDTEAVKKRLAEINDALKRWKNYELHDDLVKQVEAKAVEMHKASNDGKKKDEKPSDDKKEDGKKDNKKGNKKERGKKEDDKKDDKKGEDISLESATPEQLKEEERKRKEKEEIDRRQKQPIKGDGAVNVQPEFDLGQTGQQDLFNPIVPNENNGYSPEEKAALDEFENDIKDIKFSSREIESSEDNDIDKSVNENEQSEVMWSSRDIEKLHYKWGEKEISLKTFADTFQTLIKEKDRTIDDVNRIAKAYLDNVKNNPQNFIPQATGASLDYKRYLKMPDGTMYDPNKLEHADASDITRQIYQAEKEGRIGEVLERTAQQLNENRVQKIKDLIQYFNDNTDYTESEKAVIVNGAMKYVMKTRQLDNGELDVRIASITAKNQEEIQVVGGVVTSRIVDKLRNGMKYKNAIVEAVKEGSKVAANARGVPANFTGWKVFKKSDKIEDAQKLNDGVQGREWCTAGAVSTAQSHLSGGDFHVWYKNGEPMLAIRTNNGNLAEAPRGSLPGQFMTDEEAEIADEYLRHGEGSKTVHGGKDFLDDMDDIHRAMRDDFTWKDAIRFPFQRRGENGEYNGDTKAWPKPIQDKIKRLIDENRDEMHKEGWYSTLDIDNARWDHIFRPAVKVIFAKDIKDKNLDIFNTKWKDTVEEVVNISIILYEGVSAPKLTSVGGRLYLHKGASAPNVTTVGGGLDLREGASAPKLTSVDGDLYLHKGASAPNVTSVGGDLDLCKGASAPNVTTVGGRLYLHKGASAPNVTTVGGGLDLREGASAPKLTSVDGDLYLREGASAPNVTTVGGRLYLDEGASAPNVTSVGGGLTLHKGASAPNVTTVGGGLYLYEGASAPNVTTVGGSLDLREGASAPNVTTVGGSLYLYEGASAPNVTTVGGGLTLHKGASAPNVTTVDGDLDLCKGASAPNVTTVGGGLYLDEGASAPNVTSVGGGLTLHKGASAPNVTTVDGDLYLHKGASAPNVTSVGGDLDLCKGASAPNVTSVGGDLTLYEDASAPNVTTVGGRLYDNTRTEFKNNFTHKDGKWVRKDTVQWSSRELEDADRNNLNDATFKLVSKLSKNGRKDFESLATALHSMKPELYAKVKPHIAAAWNWVATKLDLDFIKQKDADKLFAKIEKSADKKPAKQKDEKPADEKKDEKPSDKKEDETDVSSIDHWKELKAFGFVKLNARVNPFRHIFAYRFKVGENTYAIEASISKMRNADPVFALDFRKDEVSFKELGKNLSEKEVVEATKKYIDENFPSSINDNNNDTDKKFNLQQDPTYTPGAKVSQEAKDALSKLSAIKLPTAKKSDKKPQEDDKPDASEDKPEQPNTDTPPVQQPQVETTPPTKQPPAKKPRIEADAQGMALLDELRNIKFSSRDVEEAAIELDAETDLQICGAVKDIMGALAKDGHITFTDMARFIRCNSSDTFRKFKNYLRRAWNYNAEDFKYNEVSKDDAKAAFADAEKLAKANAHKVDDYGEKLEGARKFMKYQGDIEKVLAGVSEHDLMTKPFSKFKPNLKKLLEEGSITENAARFIDAYWRTEMESKPIHGKRYILKSLQKDWCLKTLKNLAVVHSVIKEEKKDQDGIVAGILRTNMRVENGYNTKADYSKLFQMYRQMEALGHKPGEELDFTFYHVSYSYMHNGLYANHSEISFMGEVPDETDLSIELAKASRGDADANIPRGVYSIAPVSDYVKNGKFEVQYLVNKGRMAVRSIERKTFDTLEEAEEEKQRLITELYMNPADVGIKEQTEYQVIGYRAYQTLFVLPDSTTVNISTTSRDEAVKYVDEHLDEVNKKLLEQIRKHREAVKKAKESGEDKDDGKGKKAHYDLSIRRWRASGKRAVFIKSSAISELKELTAISPDFNTTLEAQEWLDANRDDIAKKFDELVAKNKEKVEKKIYFDAERSGDDYRKGMDISEKDFAETFGFRGVQFGIWANNEDRQMAINRAYDGLMDLSKLVGISPKGLSLGGQLGIAFGARGSGKASAHFETNEFVINLTKTRGAGALAHEWFHALDNYFSRQAGVDKHGFMTDSEVNNSARNRPEEVIRREMVNAYWRLMDTVTHNSYGRRQLDERKGESDYWARNWEIAARLVDTWADWKLQQKGELNKFLASGFDTDYVGRIQESNYSLAKMVAAFTNKEMNTSLEDFKKSKASLRNLKYPSEDEVKALDSAVTGFFGTIQEKVVDGNTVLFSSVELDDVARNELNNTSMKLVKYLQGKGYNTFSDLCTFIHDNAPDQYERLKPFLRKTWNYIADDDSLGIEEISKADAQKSFETIEKVDADTGAGDNDNGGGEDNNDSGESGDAAGDGGAMTREQAIENYRKMIYKMLNDYINRGKRLSVRTDVDGQINVIGKDTYYLKDEFFKPKKFLYSPISHTWYLTRKGIELALEDGVGGDNDEFGKPKSKKDKETDRLKKLKSSEDLLKQLKDGDKSKVFETIEAGIEVAKNFFMSGGVGFDDFYEKCKEKFGNLANKYAESWYLCSLVSKPIKGSWNSKQIHDYFVGKGKLKPRAEKNEHGRPLVQVVREASLPKPQSKVTADDFSKATGFKLDDDQILGINLMLDKVLNTEKGAFLLGDGTGFGKTAQLLAVMAKYHEKFPGRKILLVSQNSTVINTRFGGPNGDAARMGIDSSIYDAIPYTSLKNFAEKNAGTEYGLIVYDEAHNLKNSDALKSISSSKLKAKHKIFATATPMDRATSATYFLSEITGMPAYEIAAKLGFKYETRINRKTGKPFVTTSPLKGFSWMTIMENLHKFRDTAIISGSMLRREYPFFGEIETNHVGYQNEGFGRDISDLESDENPLSAVQRVSKYNELAKVDEAVKLTDEYLKKGHSVIVCGETVNEQMFPQPLSAVPYRAEPRTRDNPFGGVEEYFVYFTEGALGKLNKLFSSKGYNVAKIFGKNKKNKIEDAGKFQKGECNVALMTPASGGTGIDLDDQTGDKPRVMIVLTKNWSGDQWEQIIGRISRKNTKSPARIIVLETDAMSDTRRNNVLDQKISTLKAIQGGMDIDLAGGLETDNGVIMPGATNPDENAVQFASRLLEEGSPIATEEYLRDAEDRYVRYHLEHGTGDKIAQAIYEGRMRLGEKPQEVKFSSADFDEDTTAIANRSIDDWRKSVGLPPMGKTKRKKDATTVEQGMNMASNDRELSNFVSAIAQTPRAMFDFETVAVAQRAVELENTYERQLEQYDKAVKNGNKEQAKILKVYLRETEGKIKETHAALKFAGTETGRALRARRFLYTHDGTFAGLLMDMQEDVDRPLTDEEKKLARQLWDGYIDAQGKRDAAIIRKTTELLKAIFKDWHLDEKKERNLGVPGELYSDALNHIRVHSARSGGMLLGLPNARKWLDAIRRHHTYVFKRDNGRMPTVDEILELLHKDIDPIARADDHTIMQLITGHGHTTTPNQDEIEIELRKQRTLMNELQKLEDMKEFGLPPQKTGMLNDKEDLDVRNQKKMTREEYRKWIQEHPEWLLVNDPKRMKSIQDTLMTRMKNEIEKLEKAIESGERIMREKNTMTYTPEMQKLRERLEEVRAEYKEAFPPIPPTHEEQVARMVRILNNRLTKLNQKFESLKNAKTDEERQRILSNVKKEQLSDPSIDAIRDEMDNVRSQIDALEEEYFPEGTPEKFAKALQNRIKALQRNIDRNRERLAKNNVMPQKKEMSPIQKRVSEDPEVIRLTIERNQANRRIRQQRELFKRQNAHLGMGKAMDWFHAITSFPMVLRTFIDLGSVFVQGANYFAHSPIKAVKATRDTIKSFFSQEVSDQITQAMMNDPDYEDFIAHGGHMYWTSDVGERNTPEEFRNIDRGVEIKGERYTIKDVPFLGKAVVASERSYGMFLNIMALHLYKAIKNAPVFGASGPSKFQKRDFARAINELGGRGFETKGKGDIRSDIVDIMFWAARLAVAQVKQTLVFPITLAPYLSTSRADRTDGEAMQSVKLIAKMQARSILGFLALSFLATVLIGDKEPEWLKQVFDPRSSNFLSFKIGNTIFNLNKGITQWITFMARLFTGEKTGMDGVVKKVDKKTVIDNKLRGKLAPIPGLLIDVMDKKDFIGNDLVYGKPNRDREKNIFAHIIEGLTVPLSSKDVMETFDKNNLFDSLLALPLIITGAGKYTVERDADEDQLARFKADYKKYSETLKSGDMDAANEMLRDNPSLRNGGVIDKRIKSLKRLKRQIDDLAKSGKEPSEKLVKLYEDEKRRISDLISRVQTAK